MDDAARIPTAAFLRAAEEWRGTYAGPQACFRGADYAACARFVAAVALVGNALRPEIDLRPEAVTVQLRQDAGGTLPAAAAPFAAAVRAAAAEGGLRAAPEAVQTVSLAVAHHPDVDVRPFWSAVLGYRADGGGLADPLQRGPYLSFQRLDRAGRGRSHVDVSVPADTAPARVAATIGAGGRLVDADRAPAWWTLASPDRHGVDVVAWPDARN